MYRFSLWPIPHYAKTWSIFILLSSLSVFNAEQIFLWMQFSQRFPKCPLAPLLSALNLYSGSFCLLILYVTTFDYVAVLKPFVIVVTVVIPAKPLLSLLNSIISSTAVFLEVFKHNFYRCSRQYGLIDYCWSIRNFSFLDDHYPVTLVSLRFPTTLAQLLKPGLALHHQQSCCFLQVVW